MSPIPYSAAILKEQGNLDYLTISYDLNAGQVEDLLRAGAAGMV